MSNLEVYPSGYDTSKSSFSGQPISPENAYTSYEDTTYARYNLITGANANTYVYFTFDLSSIPINATIKSVNCIAKAFVTEGNTSRIAVKQLQMYCGDTAKGTASDIAYSTNSYELDTGSWTREELDSLYLKLYAKRGTQRVTTSYQLCFVGANLVIEYESGGAVQTLKIKSNGNWEDVSKVYKKENGSWIEVQDISQEFDVNANYVKEN